MTNFLLSLDMQSVQCCSCGIVFAVSEETYKDLCRTEETFYCPKGHPQHFCDSDEKKLKKALAAQKRKAEYLEAERDRARKQRDKAERSRNAYKGQITKTKNRIAKGVCPCCNRSFTNLHEHMKNQHPNYVGEKNG